MALRLQIYLWLLTIAVCQNSWANENSQTLVNDIDIPAQSFGIDGVWAFFQLILVLVIVIALAYLILNKGVGFFIKKTQANKLIKIKERMVLDQKRSLFLVEVQNRTFLLGGGDSGVSLISELNSTNLTDATNHISTSFKQGVTNFYGQTSLQRDAKLQAES
ncbi:MAG: flagellar biosynthetic protein FliO [bacterium]|nr:flagellar biosynthetic protein FliO [bacterium]